MPNLGKITGINEFNYKLNAKGDCEVCPDEKRSFDGTTCFMMLCKPNEIRFIDPLMNPWPDP